MPPNVVIQGTGEDTVSRRPQRGREQALVDDPSKVNAKKAYRIIFFSFLFLLMNYYFEHYIYFVHFHNAL